MREPNGDLVAGVEVAVVAPEEDFGSVRCLTKTDASGRFGCGAALEGHFAVSAVAPSGAVTTIAQFPPAKPIELSLVSGGSLLSGEVRDASGGVVPRAKVRLSRPRRAAFDEIYAIASDEHGRFRVALPSGSYVVRAEHDERSAQPSLVVVERETTIAVNLGPPVDASARAAAATWARRARVSLRTSDPTAPDDDLAVVDTLSGDAKIVALGESTHGSRETFQLKHRLLRRLVEQREFSVIAFEANRGEMNVAEDYIQLRTHDELAALSAFGFWTWRTDELLALLRWLRAHNAARPADRRVHLIGIDMQSTAALARSLATFAARAGARPALLNVLSILSDAKVGRASLPAEKRRQLDGEVASLESFVSEHGAPMSVRRDARVLAQALENDALDPPHDFAQRDRSMAENALAELGPERKNKVVLWAHAGHVARGWLDGVTTMGEHLSRVLASEYRPILVSFQSGSFRAIDVTGGPEAMKGVAAFDLPPAAPETLEFVTAAGATDPVLLDLRSANADARAWFEARVPTRWAGSMYVSERATVVMLAPRRAFDAVVVAPRSTPSIPAGRGT